MTATAVADLSAGMHSERRAQTQAAGHEPPLVGEPQIHLELVRGVVLMDEGEGYACEFRERRIAALRLSFDYGGGPVRLSDPAGIVFVPGPDGERAVRRDQNREAAAQRVLERFGPVEVACVEECVQLAESDVDYVVDPDGDPDVLAEFGAVAVPELRAAGWAVQLDDDYPCKVVAESSVYASLDAGEDDSNWFELELGFEVDGERVDLVPILVDVLSGSGARSLDSLERCSRRVFALPVAGRGVLAIAPERLRMILGIVRELYEVDGISARGNLQIPAAVPDLVDELRAAFGDAVEAPPEVVAAWAPEPASAEVPRRPAGLQAELRVYQQAGVRWLLGLASRGGGGVLADDMGLGKTLQTIAYLVCARARVAESQRQPALVVAPTSLVGNWRRELGRFAPTLKVLVLHGPRRHDRFEDVDASDVVITTYPLLIRDIERYAQLGFSSIVLDEAQAIKNTRSQAHQAVRVLEGETRICLTGTPIENNLEELRALFDVLMPGYLGDAASFRTRYRQPIERFGHQDRLDTLRRRVAPFVLRRVKDDVLTELPPKTETVRTVELGGQQRDLYESIRVAAHASVRGVVKKKGIAASTIDILGALMKLRQVCCDPRLVPVEAAVHVAESAKLEALIDMVLELRAAGRRMLVFSQFTSMMALISEALAAAGVEHLSLTGATRDRQGLVDDFEAGRGDVFLISLKAGGTGLNLTSADTVIHYDPWWNPAAQAQATDRAHRMGQRKPVFVYKLIVAGSVEEKMMGLQQRKAALADGLLSTQSGGLELSDADVDDLFAAMPDS
ncbi:MAG: DEAD/DEAH box helicase [Myxococcales bacterium FL481]|nr:MAG: DEAD/DEAH box helicase [Myxococcales bacterium FL481]